MSVAQRLADLKNVLAVEEMKANAAPATIADVVEVGLDQTAQAVKAHFEQAAPDSLPNLTSHAKGIVGGPTQPSLDTDKFDGFGHAKEVGLVGPRGPSMPQDSMLAEERVAAAASSENEKKALYGSTAAHDSRGEQKGTFQVTPQGHNIHGMRNPDKIDYSKPIEPPAQHGPRGTNVPKDSFHG